MAKKNTKKKSPRQEAKVFAGRGDLRSAIAGKLSEEAEELIVRVVLDYCDR